MNIQFKIKRTHIAVSFLTNHFNQRVYRMVFLINYSNSVLSTSGNYKLEYSRQNQTRHSSIDYCNKRGSDSFGYAINK